MLPRKQTSWRADLGRLLASIAAGDDGTRPVARGRAAAVLCGEDGMVTWATVVAVVFLCFLAALVFDAGRTVNEKIETQNGADAVAYSSALWMARGMNATTAANHLMGELTALYVLHHALGGLRLDKEDSDNKSGPMVETNAILETEWIALQAALPEVTPPQTVYDRCKKWTRADERSTIYEAKLQLKRVLAIAYGVHLAGTLIVKAAEASIVGAAFAAVGYAMQFAALATEWYVYAQYIILDGLEELARTLRTPKGLIPPALAALYGYERLIVGHAPVLAVQSAAEIGEANQCRTAVAIRRTSYTIPAMPVERDPATAAERCQAMRSTYPWVRSWGNKISRLLFPLVPLSGAAGYFTYWSNHYSLTVVDRFAFRSGEELKYEPKKKLPLYVVIGQSPPSVVKGREPWTGTGREDMVDELFCVMGFARRPQRSIVAAPFFRQENPDGTVCFSQAICYGANRQEPRDAIDPDAENQPQVGWDTLNWSVAVPEYQKAPRPTLGVMPSPWGVYDMCAKPEVKLNWQAKLVPVRQHKLQLAVTTTSDPTISAELPDLWIPQYLLKRLVVLPDAVSPDEVQQALETARKALTTH